MTAGPKVAVNCAECGDALMRRLFRPSDGGRIQNFFCDKSCKGSWQAKQKGYDANWLRAKYVDEGLSADEIALLVSRNAKSVWNWLKWYGIATRPRGHNQKNWFHPGHNKSPRGPVSDETKRKISASNTGKPKRPKGERHHLAGKTGPLSPTWRGGITPERQAFYASQEWRAACTAVWHRADAKCERCGKDHRQIDRKSEAFHVHHIVSFAVRELRAEPSNLALLCDRCHRHVHSRKNVTHEFLGSAPL